MKKAIIFSFFSFLFTFSSFGQDCESIIKICQSYLNDQNGKLKFISDNGDGINDTWKLIKIEDYPYSEVNIYTRSGILIYNKRNYLNTWPRDSNSDVIPAGSYYYRIDLDGNSSIDFEGWLYLTR